MFITGYHGTTLESAKSIMREKRFNLSDKDTEWLGKGVYFYFDFNDAYEWNSSDVILHSVIKINDDEYLDIDEQQGIDILNGMIDIVSSMQNKEVNPKANVQKNQCALMKMIWDSYPKLKVIAASFPKEPTKFKILLDRRAKRKEFCVRNNNYIKCTQLIKKGDLND